MTTLTFDAHRLAQAWLSVELASAPDVGKDPTFGRSVGVELFRDGVRLTACDRYMMLTCWVPTLSVDDTTAEPDLDEGPKEKVVARDLNKRAHALMAYVWALVDVDTDTEILEATMEVAEAEPSVQMPALDGMEGEVLVLEVPGRESLRVGTYEGEWPDWRSLIAHHVGRSTHAVALTPSRIAKLAKLGPYHDDAPLVWHFGGTDGAALVATGDPPVTVRGVVMPVRWSWGEAAVVERAETDDGGSDDDSAG